MMGKTKDKKEARELLIDALLACSLLTQRVAQILVRLGDTDETKEGEKNDGKDAGTGHCSCRVVRAYQGAE